MGDRSPPTPELLLVLADIGPVDDRPRSIKRCCKRVTRMRDNLLPNPPGVSLLPDLESHRARSLWSLSQRCRVCARCPGPPPRG